MSLKGLGQTRFKTKKEFHTIYTPSFLIMQASKHNLLHSFLIRLKD